MKKQMLNIVILAAAAVVLVGTLLFTDGPSRLWEALRSVKPVWLSGAAGCMAAYWAAESLALHLSARRLYPRQRLRDSIRVSMIGQLFNCITPFATGGQPIQAYHLVRCGMPLGPASSALLMKSIVYQVVLVVYSLTTLFLRFSFFNREVPGFGPLVLTGFSVNALVVGILWCVCCFPGMTSRLLGGMVRLGGRLRLVRDVPRTLAHMQGDLDAFHGSFTLLRHCPGLLCGLCALFTVQLSAFFLAPLCICRALGSGEAGTLDVIAAAAFVLMISSFVPLPGASGGAEGSFFLFFGIFFESPILARMAVLLWRGVTFYLPIAVGSCFAAGTVPAISGREENSVMLPQ